MNARATMQWLRRNGVDTAAFTGTDHRTLQAIARIWDVYAVAGDEGRASVIVAVRALLHPALLQKKCDHAARQLIAAALDWEDVEPIWSRVLEKLPGDERAKSIAAKLPIATMLSAALDRASEEWDSADRYRVLSAEITKLVRIVGALEREPA